MKPINLNQIPTEYILKTKAGKLWRCGKGYRKNWAKLIGKLVLLHNTPYTLINRIKEAGKWYLIFTDGNNNYTERQDKALHNKKLAKDTIIEAVKRVIAGLLPAPKELIDKIVDIVKPIGHTLSYDLFIHQNGDSLQNKLDIISLILQLDCNDGNLCRKIYKQLRFHYHPDRNSDTTTEIYQHIQERFEQWVNNK